MARARHLGIPLDPLAAVKIIAEDHIIKSDYGAVNGRRFFCTFGVGFDAAVSSNLLRCRAVCRHVLWLCLTDRRLYLL